MLDMVHSVLQLCVEKHSHNEMTSILRLSTDEAENLENIFSPAVTTKPSEGRGGVQSDSLDAVIDLRVSKSNTFPLSRSLNGWCDLNWV